MTRELAPDSPVLLDENGKPAASPGDTIADGYVPALDEKDNEAKKSKNLGKIAKSRKEKRGAARTEG